MRIEDMLRVISSSILPSVVSNEGVEGLRITTTAKLSMSATVAESGEKVTDHCQVQSRCHQARYFLPKAI
jgi:hypothetical protein